ncbi:MAG TPA: hypothetical protein VFC00_24570 [Micromonosporaceae bacterium]|nr:hypothetical protein [Micromonosporaceae bacterium]
MPVTAEQRRAFAQRAGRVSARLREVDGLARHIERVVAAAPPLTDEQRAKLAALLLPANCSTVDGGGAA